LNHLVYIPITYIDGKKSENSSMPIKNFSIYYTQPLQRRKINVLETKWWSINIPVPSGWKEIQPLNSVRVLLVQMCLRTRPEDV
jgi:hypothetical protein